MITKQIWPIDITDEIHFFVPFIHSIIKSKETNFQQEAIQYNHLLNFDVLYCFQNFRLKNTSLS